MKSLSTFLIFVLSLSLASFYILFITPFKTHSPNHKALDDVLRNIYSLEKEHNELRRVIDGLETGHLSPFDPSVLKVLRSQPQNFGNSSAIGTITPPQKPQEQHASLQTIHTQPSTSKTGIKKELTNSNEKENKIRSHGINEEYVLIIGGTDGSGTRRVVQLLSKMGVKIVSEDPETYDIHGDLMGGWPVVVSPIIQVNYTLYI